MVIVVSSVKVLLHRRALRVELDYVTSKSLSNAIVTVDMVVPASPFPRYM